MLDWFGGYVGYDASQLTLGQILYLEKGGEVVRSREMWETAQGSYDHGVQVTRAPPTDQMLGHGRELGFLCADHFVLRVSGNPTKLLQGHNAAGPSVSMLGPVLQAMVRAFGEGLRPSNADDETLPAVQRSRVDVATAIELDSHERVHEWLRLAATTTRSRHGRAMTRGITVYWGDQAKRGHRRWVMKAYCKHCELQKNVPDVARTAPALYQELLEWTRSHLRLEVELYRPELKERGTLEDSIVWEYARRLEMPTMKAGRRMDDVELRPAVRAVLQLWLDGHEVSVMFPKATFYKYRREILDEAGVDISMDAAAQVDAEPNALLGLEELHAREVIEIPDRIQRSLFGSGL
jgi:hypothetical protein